MNWISIKSNKPARDETVLVYKYMPMGGYPEGVYIAEYVKGYRDQYFFVIDDRETDKNNYRLLEEFSHWMPLPEKPKSAPVVISRGTGNITID